jgi:hypothetical protein
VVPSRFHCAISRTHGCHTYMAVMCAGLELYWKLWIACVHDLSFLSCLSASRRNLCMRSFSNNPLKHRRPQCIRKHSNRVAFILGLCCQMWKFSYCAVFRNGRRTSASNRSLRCCVEAIRLNRISLCRVDITVLDKSCGGSKEDAFDLGACAKRMVEEEALYREEFGRFMSNGHT